MAMSDLQFMMRQNGRMTPLTLDQIMKMSGQSAAPDNSAATALPGMGTPFTPAANDPNIAAANEIANRPVGGGASSSQDWINGIKAAATAGANPGMAFGGVPPAPPPGAPPGMPPAGMAPGMPPGAPPGAPSGLPPTPTPQLSDTPPDHDVIHKGGLIPSATGGRADAIKMQVPDGSYMVPAHIVAALGDGNTLAGAKVLDHVVQQAKAAVGMHPSQAPLAPPGIGGGQTPTLPAGLASGGVAGNPILPASKDMPFANANKQFSQPPQMTATPNKFAPGQPNRLVPINASGGEYLIDPAGVSAIGGGDVTHGHDILDMTMRRIARRNVAKLKTLPPPRKG